MALDKRAAFRSSEYWGRPVPGFGDPNARLLIAGLAPAAHGGNRTGRIFTGDRSGDWLFASLHRTGIVNQPTSESLNDGLVLHNAWVTAAVKCAPPANKPTIEERDQCVSRYFSRELQSLPNMRVVVCLGKFAYDVVCRQLEVKQRPLFTHGVETFVKDGIAGEGVAGDGVAKEGVAKGVNIIGSYHPSQQNTFTGKLTEPMLDDVFKRALEFV